MAVTNELKPGVDVLAPIDDFAPRHLGPSADEARRMLETLGVPSLEALIDETVPASIRLRRPLALPPAGGERQRLEELRALAARNQVYRSLIGLGYHDTFTPPR